MCAMLGNNGGPVKSVNTAYVEVIREDLRGSLSVGCWLAGPFNSGARWPAGLPVRGSGDLHLKPERQRSGLILIYCKG